MAKAADTTGCEWCERRENRNAEKRTEMKKAMGGILAIAIVTATAANIGLAAREGHAT